MHKLHPGQTEYLGTRLNSWRPGLISELTSGTCNVAANVTCGAPKGVGVGDKGAFLYF